MGFYGYSSLFMTEEAGKILVYGDFTMASTLQMDHHLTAGTLEVKGDFTQSANYDYYGKNFYAQGSHKVILSGKGSKNGKDYIQTVTFTQPGMSKMNTLILTKNQKKYSFESKGKEIEDLETIAAKVQYVTREEAAPMPPSALSVMEVTCTSGVLTWEESKSETPVMGYDIYQDGKKIATISGTSYHLQGLQPNTSYEYAVQAFTENGTYSLLSDSITVTTAKDTTPPEVVKGLRMGKRTGATITLKWDKATDDVEIMDYEIYRNGEKIATVTECIYEDKELKENTTYEYYVIARDTSSQCSEPSNTISASTASPRITRILPQDQEMIGGNTLPLTVEFIDTGNATNNQIKVEYQTKDTDWVPFHDGYLLQQEGDKLGTLKVEKEFSLEEIQGEEITVRITLKDEAGVETSQEVTYYIDKEGATAPEGLSATSKNQVVTLEWKPSVSGDCDGWVYDCKSRRNGISKPNYRWGTLRGRHIIRVVYYW